MESLRKSPLPLIAVFAFAGMLLVYLITAAYGPGVSTDAVEYLSAAESLAKGEGFTNYKGEPYVYWAPLYPVLLAVPRVLFDIDPFLSGWILNGVTFGVIIYLCGTLVASYIPDLPLWAWLGAATALFSTTLMGVSANIGTDPLFIVLVLLFLLFFNRYAARADSQSFGLLILLTGMAVILRYIGVTLILTGGILLLYFHRTDWKTGITRAAVFGTLSFSPLLVWMIRNLTVTRTLFGARYPSAWLFSENLRDAGIKISHWFIPYTISSNLAFWTITGLVVVLILVLSPHGRLSLLAKKILNPAYLPVLLFTIIYLGAILALTKTEDHVELYDDRYYAPILILLFLLLFQLIHDLVLPLFPAHFSRLAPWVILGVFSLWLVYPIFSSYKLWEKTQKEEGVPYYNIYNLPRFRESTITRAMEGYLPASNSPVYSNYSAAVYLYSRRQAESSPSKRGDGDSTRELQSYRGDWPSQTPAILVWFEPNTKGYLFPPAKLGRITSLHPLFTSRDGGIYRLGGE